jgi:hypothetical protein
MKGSKSVVGWPLETGRDVRVKTCVNGMSMLSPESQVLLKGSLYVP